MNSKGHVARGAGLAFRTGAVDCWIGIVQDGDGRLVRLRVGPVRLGRLPPGQVRELALDEVRALLRATQG